MSIEKRVVEYLQPTEDKKKDNPKLEHIYHSLSRVYKTFKETAPTQAKDITKYDLVLRDIDEIILILKLRESKYKKIDKYANKCAKMVDKL